MMTELLLLFLSASVTNNFVFYRFLGICPFLGVSKKLSSATGMGLAVTFVVMGATAVTLPLYEYFLSPFNLPFLKTIAFILVIASLVQMLEFIIKKMNPGLYSAFGIYLALITTNCMVLGAVLLNIQEGYNFIQALVFAFGAGAGFTLALTIMAGIRERIEYAEIPGPLKGVPIAFILSGLLAIAFSGFAGMG